MKKDARLTALFLWTLQTTRTTANNRPVEEAEEEPEESDEPGEDDEEEKPRKPKGGLTLPFDTFIRITRPMGIHYQTWLGRIIEIEKGIVRLIPVAERKEALLGEEIAEPMVEWGHHPLQLKLFELPETSLRTARTRRGSGRRIERVTTMDRLHTAMLLFGAGQSILLNQLLEDEHRQGRRFEHLALALTALYPDKSQERRWLEGLQTMMKR